MKLTEITRRDIIDRLLSMEHPFHGRLDILSFLKRVWDLSSMPSSDHRFQDAEGDIWQHMVRNDDWTDEYLLFDRLDILGVNDETFMAFVAACLHPIVLRDDTAGSELVSELNGFLQRDGYALLAKEEISGHPVYTAVRLASASASAAEAPTYEVVLSFAGEDREYVEKVASCLKSADVSVFYDRYEEVTLWGKDLYDHLDKIYRGSARYCVMFISQHYASKVWTNHERKSAFARALEEKEEYVLPARFDDTEIPGLRSTIGYVDLRQKKPEEFAHMVLVKLGRAEPKEPM